MMDDQLTADILLVRQTHPRANTECFMFLEVDKPVTMENAGLENDGLNSRVGKLAKSYRELLRMQSNADASTDAV